MFTNPEGCSGDEGMRVKRGVEVVKEEKKERQLHFFNLRTAVVVAFAVRDLNSFCTCQ